MRGEEFVIQFADGPTLYARYEGFAKPAASGASGFGIAGPKGGVAELDNFTMWSIKPAAQPEWEKARAKLPQFTPVPVKAVPAKKAVKQRK